MPRDKRTGTKKPLISTLNKPQKNTEKKQWLAATGKVQIIHHTMQNILNRRLEGMYEALPEEFHADAAIEPPLTALKSNYANGTPAEKFALSYLQSYINNPANTIRQLPQNVSFAAFHAALNMMLKYVESLENKMLALKEGAPVVPGRGKRVCPF